MKTLAEVMSRLSKSTIKNKVQHSQDMINAGKLKDGIIACIKTQVKTIVHREEVSLDDVGTTFPVTVEEVSFFEFQRVEQNLPQTNVSLDYESSPGSYKFTHWFSLKKGMDYGSIKGRLGETLHDAIVISKNKTLGIESSLNLSQELWKKAKGFAFAEGSAKAADSTQLIPVGSSEDNFFDAQTAEAYFPEQASNELEIATKFQNSIEKSSQLDLSNFSEKISNQLGGSVRVKSISEKEAVLYCKAFSLDWPQFKSLLVDLKTQGYTSLTVRVVKDSVVAEAPVLDEDSSETGDGKSLHLSIIDLLKEHGVS